MKAIFDGKLSKIKFSNITDKRYRIKIPNITKKFIFTFFLNEKTKTMLIQKNIE